MPGDDAPWWNRREIKKRMKGGANPAAAAAQGYIPGTEFPAPREPEYNREQIGSIPFENEQIPVYTYYDENNQFDHVDFDKGFDRDRMTAIGHQVGGPLGFFPNIAGIYGNEGIASTALSLESYLFGNSRRESMLSSANPDVGNLILDQTHTLDGLNAREIQRKLFEWDLNGNEEELAKLQVELVDGNFMDEPLVWGRLDANTQGGMDQLLTDSYQWASAGFDLSFKDVLGQASGFGDAAGGRGRGGGGGGGGRTFAFQQMSPDELALVIDRTSQSLIGRSIDDTNKQALVESIQADIKAQARQRFDVSESGGEFTQEPADVMAGRGITSQFSDEVGAVNFQEQANVLRGMLGGL